MFKKALIAVLVLGKKKSDQDYSEKDTVFLTIQSKNLGVSINNAMSFKFKADYYVLMAEKNKTDVLARLSEGIDHEIKNPLNAIKPAAQRILMSLPKMDLAVETKAKLEEYATMIVRNSDRIVSIMTRLRNFARPIRTQEDFKMEPMGLREYVNEAIELVSRKQLELDGIVIENEIPDDIRIFGEGTAIIQVFWNLINNAYHAIGRNGKVRITARMSENGGKVITEVRDTGWGSSAERMQNAR
jgi:signal transduction histidine kinase